MFFVRPNRLLLPRKPWQNFNLSFVARYFPKGQPKSDSDYTGLTNFSPVTCYTYKYRFMSQIRDLVKLSIKSTEFGDRYRLKLLKQPLPSPCLCNLPEMGRFSCISHNILQII